MKTLRSQFHLLGCTNLTHPTSNSPAFVPIKAKTQLKHPAYPSRILAKTRNHAATKHEDKPAALLEFTSTKQLLPKSEHSRFFVVGAVSVGIVWFLMAMDDQKALALGPEGPLMEEFWENVRRYGLYALTVSTGALYTIFEPIGELLKNPITAVLILLIFGGSFYVLSQILELSNFPTVVSEQFSYGTVGFKDYSRRLMDVMNQMRLLGKVIEDQKVVEKMMVSLPQKKKIEAQTHICSVDRVKWYTKTGGAKFEVYADFDLGQNRVDENPAQLNVMTMTLPLARLEFLKMKLRMSKANLKEEC